MHRLHNRRDLLLFVPPIHLEEAEMDQDFVLHIIVGVQPGLRSFILRWRLFGYLPHFCLFVLSRSAHSADGPLLFVDVRGLLLRDAGQLQLLE